MPEGPTYQVLATDYDRMLTDGMLLDDEERFDELVERCATFSRGQISDEHPHHPTVQTDFRRLICGMWGPVARLVESGMVRCPGHRERPAAFRTIEHNLIAPETCPQFDWPPWFPKEHAPSPILTHGTRNKCSIARKGHPRRRGGTLPRIFTRGPTGTFRRTEFLVPRFARHRGNPFACIGHTGERPCHTTPFTRSEGTCANRVSVATRSRLH